MSEEKFTKGKHDVSLISWMDEEYVGPYTETPEEAEANAKLYSAAPEMYEALNTLLTRWADGRGFDGSEVAKEMLTAAAALAKARGEQ